MKAVEIHDFSEAKELFIKPQLDSSLDAIVRITTTGICCHYLQFIRRTETRPKSTLFNHEALGVVEVIGDGIKRLAVGDRVLIPKFIAKSYCPCCQDQSDVSAARENQYAIGLDSNLLKLARNLSHMPANQISYVRVPCADKNLIKLEDGN